MSKAWVAVSALVSVASLGVAMWALDEARQAHSQAGGGAAPAAAAGSEALEARIAHLEERAAAGGTIAAAPPGGSVDMPPPGAPGAALPPGVPPEEGLRALVRQTVREEADAREKERAEGKAGKEPPPGEGRKPPLSQIAAELDLDEAQREAVHQAVLRGQEETLALLRTPTPGGRVPLDDLMKALLEKPENARTQMVEVFGMLATEKVPGSSETYAQRLEGVKKATAENFRRTFTPEQFKAYEKTGQDPLEIQVPDSPWIQVLQDAWKAKR